MASGWGSVWAAAAEKYFERRARHMGTEFVIKGYATTVVAFDTAATSALNQIAEIDSRLSDYNPQSELRRLTAEGSPAYDSPVTVSDDLGHVLQYASQLHQASGGAVDVTIGPLSRLWRRSRRRHQLPTKAQIAAAKARVNFAGLELVRPKEAQSDTPAHYKVRLRHAAMRFDLGAIAKGYAADTALTVMRQHGLHQSLVDAGGDLAIGDAPPAASGWVVRVAPGGVDHGELRCLCLTNCGVATSGDVARGVQLGQQYYSHIIDPRTGYGLTDRLAVTVVAPIAMQADGLASAASVLGSERGAALIETIKNAQAVFVTQMDDSTTSKQTSGFESIPKCQTLEQQTLARSGLRRVFCRDL